MHSRVYDRLLRTPSGFAESLLGGFLDVLSEVLRAVKLQGAMYYNGEFALPWRVRSPAGQTIAPHLGIKAKHVIVYHLLLGGRASVRLEQGKPLMLEAGDIVVLPHGDPHIVENGSAPRTVDISPELDRIFSQGLKLWRLGGGGELTRFVCGYMACEPRLSQVFLSGLPPLFKISLRDQPSGKWLEDSIRFSADEAVVSRPGGEAVLTKLAEVLFMETLRAYVADLSPKQTGWLAGTRDAVVGKALALMHRSASHPWTVDSIAKEAGVSRSVLAERFRHYLNEPPMAYLTRWRLQLGAEMLLSQSHPVAQIAAEVGYESEAAFNRAFRREFQIPPARFRAQARSTPASRPK
jgi:AraC-like DNA-binding protein